MAVVQPRGSRLSNAATVASAKVTSCSSSSSSSELVSFPSLEDQNKSIQDKYTKERKVGEGTYAVVYLGKQQVTKRPIAIKEIKTGLFKDGLDMSAIREVKYLQELKHRNIITLIDVFSSSNNLNLVLDFLPADLEVLIKDKSIVFKSADIKSWMLMTLRGIHHCHRNHILHRDLKPNNLLISPSGELKIADFGLARSLGNPNEDLSSNVVTRWYRAPELLFGAKHYTEAIDIWSIGIIFAELMLRIPYLAGKDDVDQLDVTFRAYGTPTEQIWPNVSSLPLYNALHIYPPPSRQEMRSRFSAATDKALDFLILLTQLDPSRRCNSTQALLHEYFTESPRPTEPENLPKKKNNKRENEDDDNLTSSNSGNGTDTSKKRRI
ncbi:KIN28 [Candida oxycetoniae]|uniref:[RNA-polymerase]-subunit kinase n=1 Tax=Candida oxycetoniae TaxID=497107 RepID=A0AAI9SX35_9ASCO|nr:KIN28 [Candida oxycetoniae]KAI3404345.2 KIN28 [Candida oxycetoniae]